jgi:peptidoglycan/LPS O-acetylase OafA/YrhL
VQYPDYVTPDGLSRSILVAYEALSRPFWGVVVGWILFLCSTNQGGIVNSILSWPIWAPLARLNYSAYLIHFMVILVTLLNQTIPTYVQPHMLVNIFISNLFFSYLAAIVGVIFFETPFLVLEKKLLKH